MDWVPPSVTWTENIDVVLTNDVDVVVELVGVAALYALHRLLRIGRKPRSKEKKQW